MAEIKNNAGEDMRQVAGQIAELSETQRRHENRASTLAEYNRLVRRQKAASRAVAKANAELRAADEAFSAFMRSGR